MATGIRLGVDVGGTQARAARLADDGSILATRRADTPNDPAKLVDWIAEAVHSFLSDGEDAAAGGVTLGVAVPGLVDAERGEILRSVNLPALEGFPLADQLLDRLRIRPLLMSDAWAAAWAEYGLQPDRPDPFVHLRLGTGVGCQEVASGRLVPRGDGRKHLEVLMVERSADAIDCPCGRRGCLETVAGGRALEAAARKAGVAEGIAGLQVGFSRGDLQAVEIVSRAVAGVRVALANLHAAHRPQVISLGGGVLRGLPALAEGVMGDNGGSSAAPDLRVELARLGDEAGVLGAAMLAGEA